MWFKENRDSIKHGRQTNFWWRDNTFFIERDLALKSSLFIRTLIDFGYELTRVVRGNGLFAVRGGIIEVWPVNEETPYLIEFTGNTVTDIKPREAATEVVTPRPHHEKDIEALPLGSYVVHEDHGIGIFRGTTVKEELGNWKLKIENSITKKASSFFVMEYAPPAPGRTPDYLYVPVNKKDRLTPYVGFETPRIHRLGGTVWITTKRKAREDAEKFAQELLALYASRTQATRAPLHDDPTIEETLHASFPYEETDGQRAAEADIAADLERSYPMDRVLCGDVGFGKTEVALRAALKVIASGKQVALVTPTTILAAQHERTFAERLRELPISVRMLSRLVPPDQAAATTAGISDGTVDCVIGTHRLLSRDIVFKNLGLVIIDEEQRFGVRHKEHFKKLRADVDLLSLSATPIPRTLHLALAKLRDMSLLETPPPDRLSVLTHVLPYSPKIIRGAIAQELIRGGQVYFLHNRIETLALVKRQLEKLITKSPLLTNTHDRGNLLTIEKLSSPVIGIIHGRMKEKQLISVMNAFREKKIHILLATTIIENGLDISSANTLIVGNALRLGLAESHQLRGRIGRGALQAHAYFLYRPRQLTEKAAERLRALQSYANLGAGYEIALRDLQIRGAGNILGREQSGALNKVGLNLYYHMLSDALEDHKKEAQ